MYIFVLIHIRFAPNPEDNWGPKRKHGRVEKGGEDKRNATGGIWLICMYIYVYIFIYIYENMGL
jgi:hypothetical protein